MASKKPAAKKAPAKKAAKKVAAKNPKPKVPVTRGAPSKYRPVYAEQAQKLCLMGATDIELADFFGVSDRTIYRWAAQFADFCQALKAGKSEADERVERSLFHKAVGYSFDSEKVFQFQGEIVRTKTREHVPPDTTAGIFWLKNRRRDQWRDRVDHEHGGKIEHEHSGLTPEERIERIKALKEKLGV